MRAAVAALALGLAALLAVAGRPASAAPTAAQRERLDAADALLGEEATWGKAIDTYRALLTEAPDWVRPRLQLARVLAWRGDYDAALSEFDRLAAAPSPPPTLDVERAEVLSWAGRNEEAAAIFARILAAHPGDARAARGMARVKRWSDQRAAADVWYRRALALAEDPEARSEWQALRAELTRSIGGRFHYFSDSEHFHLLRSTAESALDWDFDTRLLLTTGSVWIGQQRQADAAGLGGPDSDHAFEGRLGIVRDLGSLAKGTLELGGRRWDRAGARFLGRAGLEYTPDEGTSLALALDRDDELDSSYSLQSVERRIGRTSGRLSLWRQLSGSLEGYVEGGGAWLDDSNDEVFGGASASWRPFSGRDVHLALALDAQHFGAYSPDYYAPALDIGATLSLAGRWKIAGPLAFVFDVGGGAGLSRELRDTSTGPSYRAKLGLAWQRDGFSVEVDGSRTSSQRAIEYVTQEVELAMSWRF